ncbi:hypothetical protein [Arthrobacter crystallopoietes]|uniref:Uncharacterized protein n=1 Tax=Crystallibacter crystallopoietes TaxID=37928 RepID=A0A1H0XLA5_9MICC|nr:hypothetical protein [Arthrobacter crystallopoietes]SDQ03685.1 hypothetical protein SAMN04489742_0147 [Arthrobacter crystallopoietes]
MRTVEPGHITSVVRDFLNVSEGDQPSTTSRSRSWDYCYNYFQDTAEPTQDLERSCLQLGYYLASWGMLRGSTYLFTKTNVHHYAQVIQVIEKLNPTMRSVNADSYLDEEARTEIIGAYKALRKALVPEGVTHVTLVGKVMLGVWGCVPSFDTYFRRGFGHLADKRGEKSAFNRLNNLSLTLLGEFHDRHRDEISDLAGRYTTLAFDGEFTARPLPFAKVIDMYGFQRSYAT